MTSKNISSNAPIDYASLTQRMLIGGAIALLAIAFFIIPTEGKPEWGAYWKIRPFIITPLAGLTGGACNYFIVNWFRQNGWSKAIAYIISFIVFFIGLWMGIVLGLAGTLWD